MAWNACILGPQTRLKIVGRSQWIHTVNSGHWLGSLQQHHLIPLVWKSGQKHVMWRQSETSCWMVNTICKFTCEWFAENINCQHLTGQALKHEKKKTKILNQIEKKVLICRLFLCVTELNNSWGKYTVISVAYYSKFSNSKLWNPPDCEVLNWTFAPPEVSTKSFLLYFQREHLSRSCHSLLATNSCRILTTWINTHRPIRCLPHVL